ncbi:23S ribosomal RNA methyltransferase Erm [Metabacillus arenae]|uniref:rRNA adenine N-6-methyltransferase n=1 Tax=Metabacillus arenae TaxID=2771434 RepID=A0A926NLI6_9BACI|nr:23S ribosomal RNA methyltransferase Erm [Metabacillus arenae]MBD1382813.1 23S ribosomal RNA methyltransferase Erm [Metabacillus arenae]
MRRQNKRHRKVRKCIEGPNFSGQHLMHNKQIIKDLIEKANVSSSDTVVELGAGKGALTFPLAEKAGKVLAIEYDEGFVEVLQRKAASNSNIKIIQKDILSSHLPKEPFTVVANIPYAITTPILKMLLNQPNNSLRRGVLVMEKGAAKRFTSDSITNPLILKWRMWFDLEYVKGISRKNFSPPPKVDSAVLRIRRKVKPPVHPRFHASFTGLAEYSLKYPKLEFHQALKGVFTPPQMKHLVRNLGVNRDTPIHLLTEHQWGIVFNTMVQYVKRPNWPKAKKY